MKRVLREARDLRSSSIKMGKVDMQERQSLTAPLLPSNYSDNMSISSKLSNDDFRSSFSGKSITLSINNNFADDDASMDVENMSISYRLSAQRHLEKAGKTVSGSQFKMPNSATNKCELCEENDRSLKKAKETIRALKLQLSRLEDKYIGLKKSKTIDIISPESADPNEINELRSIKEDLQRRCDVMELEISNLKKSLMREKYNSDDLKNTIEKLESLIEELDKSKVDMAHTHEMAITEKDEHITSLQEHVNSLTNQLAKSQLEIKALLKKCETTNVLPNLQKELENEKREHATTVEKNRSLNTKYLDLEQKFDLITKKYNALEAEKAETDAFLQSKLLELDDVHQQLDTMTKKYNELEIDFKSSKSYQAGMEADLELRKEQIGSLTDKTKSLEHDIERANSKIGELMRKIKTEHELHKKALETAIAGSIRLCVVAPTVNVHISEKKIKLKGFLSDTALREFLTGEVLSKYSFLFKQMADDTAPDGAPLQVWIQKMLNDMQLSIEQHVNTAMDGSR